MQILKSMVVQISANVSGISADTVEGNVKHRERRLSITYRKVILKKVKNINPDGKVAKMLQEHFNINSGI
jgi:alkylated DNA repair protein alkB family protein 8